MNKIIVIDGNSLLFRAYFATSFTGKIMTTKSGIPTNAIYAFSNMISKIVSSLKDNEKIFVSFDTGKKTFRHEQLDSYKAQRKPIDEELKIQLPIARELLKAMNIFYYEVEGFEGDDVAGTVAKLASKNGYEVEIYTSDKDFLQLIDDHIKINMIKKGLTDIEVMTEVTLKEKMGLTPIQITDYKGLTGDASDNLKGIPGIGDKTAIKLLNQYNSLEGIIEGMKNQKSKLAEKIISGSEEGLLCKRIATIKTDVPLPFSLDDLVYMGYDYNTLSSFYSKYEFYSLIKKLKPTDKRVILTKNEAKKDCLKKIYVNSFKEIPETNSIIFDIIGTNYASYRINGIVFSKDNNCYYLPYSKAKTDNDFIEFISSEKDKITYDYKSSYVALRKDGIIFNGVSFDLLLAAYLLNSSLGNNPISVYSYFGVNILENSDEINLFDESPMFFNMSNALITIKEKAINDLKAINCLSLYNDIELPLSKVLGEMEVEGFPIDIATLDSINNKYQEILDNISNKIYEIAEDKTLNISSPKQIADLLFNKLKLPSNKKQSTSIEVLTSLYDQHEIIPLIIEHRKYSKIISTYTQGLKEYIQKDNKIHASFNQALTATGRLSSSEPNLQNISIRTEEGKEIRKAFFYKENNINLLSLDYSQIELRVLASLANCKPLIEAFNNDDDIHKETAKKIFGKSDEEITDSLRRKAKTVNFGIVYGISDWGLAEQLSISIQEAKEIINKFYEHYPEIKDYFNKVVNFAKENGYVETLFNRRRYIQELNSDNYQTREFGKRAAMNAPIQGTAADLIKIAMIKTQKVLKENNLKSKIVLQIHDELIIKTYKDEEKLVYSLVKESMENAYQFLVKLKVDGSIGKTWFDAK